VFSGMCEFFKYRPRKKYLGSATSKFPIPTRYKLLRLTPVDHLKYKHQNLSTPEVQIVRSIPNVNKTNFVYFIRSFKPWQQNLRQLTPKGLTHLKPISL
jgi:hypothetical protein